MKRALPATRRQVELQTIIKSSRAGWLWLLPGVGVCMIGVGANAAPLSGEGWLFLLTIMAGFGLITAAALSHRIVISATEITIHQVFSKSPLLLTNIEHIGLRGVTAGHCLLELSGSELPNSPLSFDLQLYSPAAVISLVRTLKHYAPEINLNHSARNAFQGYFL